MTLERKHPGEIRPFKTRRGLRLCLGLPHLCSFDCANYAYLLNNVQREAPDGSCLTRRSTPPRPATPSDCRRDHDAVSQGLTLRDTQQAAAVELRNTPHAGGVSADTRIRCIRPRNDK